jgi:hypothetical protein
MMKGLRCAPTNARYVGMNAFDHLLYVPYGRSWLVHLSRGLRADVTTRMVGCSAGFSAEFSAREMTACDWKHLVHVLMKQ